ncbi:MAG: GPR endopeptidase [Clostridia bacterium]|nr:GPR endopeptidase [Clostridia bacterium]
MPYFARTDLALESFESGQGSGLPGVHVSHWDTSDIRITEVVITDADAARRLNKPEGNYLTLDCPQLRSRDPEARMALSALLAEEIARILPEADSDRPVLVVGLGNRSITPDSLGPLTIDRTLVTRHVLEGPYAPDRMDSVCAIAPGVLGVTGIETVEFVDCLSKRLNPRAVICIDSLAARDSQRIGSTIQLTNTGIQPGAGVGNHRKAITAETLGVPVISLGMPTVIYAATLARDAFEYLTLQTGDDSSHEAALEDMEKSLLNAEIGEMIVTPREIDALIQDAAGVIATGINRALQPGLSDSEIAAMMD